AGGRTMSDGWLWRGRSSAKMIEDAAAAGRWLKAFHDSGVTGYGALDLQDMLLYLAEKVDRANSRFKELPVVTNACAALSRTAGAGAAGGEFPVTWLHGDFKAANVLFVGEQEQPVGIDLQLGPGEIGLHDIVNFIVNLDLVSLEPRSLRLLQCREAVVREFVAGYFGSSQRVPAFTLLWMRLHLTVMMWAAR